MHLFSGPLYNLGPTMFHVKHSKASRDGVDKFPRHELLRNMERDQKKCVRFFASGARPSKPTAAEA